MGRAARRAPRLRGVGDGRDLGLFPLDLVLLPGETVPLHLFEPRYRQLYADCVLDDRPFVLVRSGPTGTEDVGCAARFETLVQRFDDGRLDVIVRGVEPVRIVEETEGRLYFSALVEALVDEPGEPPAELVAEVVSRMRDLAGLADAAVPETPEGVPLSYGVAGAFELPAGAKQSLLETRDETSRLRRLVELFDAIAGQLEHAAEAARRAGTNGRVTTP